jgi:voltage-gated potassium channel
MRPPLLIVYKLFFKFYREVLELKLWLMAAMAAVFFVVSWFFFRLAGEIELTSSIVDFIYFAATTASTVGYGDISPQTKAGRLVAAFWFFPGSLLIFSAVLGRLAGVMVERIRRMADGYGNYESMTGATVIVGYHRDQTPLMVDNLIAGHDGDDKIILLAKDAIGDIPKNLYLVKSDRLDALSSLRRAGIPQAQKAIVYADSDAETFNTCLAIRELNEELHIAAYFEDRDTARRAGKIAGIEPVVSNACESLVRAAQDPGSGKILMALSAADVGATIYSAIVGNEVKITNLDTAIRQTDATLIAISQPNDPDVYFRPFPDTLAASGVFYYLAEVRLSASQLSDGLEGDDVSIIV